jgi:hypothetical protein
MSAFSLPVIVADSGPSIIPLAPTYLAAWRCSMRPMQRQNRLRPAPRSRRKICRRAMGEEDGASFNLASPARGLVQRARRQLVPPEVRIFVQRPRQVSVALRLL